MISKFIKFTLLTFGLAILGFMGFSPSAQAAVPVWIVGFDANTEFETSLEGFLVDLMAQISARGESFQQAYDLAKIMKAREDVNKLIFEAFSELRSEPLLLEFQKIKQSCINQTSETPSGEGFDPGDDARGQCLFYTEVQEYLRSRGLEIVSKPFKPTSPNDSAAVQNALDNDVDPLCLYGVRTNDGECIVIKLEGRIITNPDDFLFEEPIQKARDFLYCYFGPWRHYPWAATQEEADTMRDNMKNHFLLNIARKLKFTQTAPPAEWYTEARCQIILASMQCPLAAQPQSAISSSAVPKDTSTFPVLNRDRACVARELVNSPTLATPLEFMSWTIKDLHEAVTREENTVNATYTKVANTVASIIADYERLREAQYIAGQGIRPEKYLIGYRAYTGEKDGSGNYTPDSEYGKLVAAWQKGQTVEDEGIARLAQPTGDWFYFDTENIISPAVILLQKMQAATQAEFDLAQQAFQSPEVPDNDLGDGTPASGPDPCSGSPPPPTLPNIEYVCQNVINGTGTVVGHIWLTKPKDASGDVFSGYHKPLDEAGQPETPNSRAASAPWEDPNVKLPPEYLTGQFPKSKDEQANLTGNYFNQWYKDILELHKWHFSAIVQQWFQKPEKSFFVPDR